MFDLPTSAVLAAALAVPLPVMAGPPITAIPAEQIAWEETPEGVAFGALEGDRFTQSYMAMVRLPAGTVSPAHMKSANMFGVMIAGSMTHVASGGDAVPAPVLTAGAFYMIPAGVPHVSSCVSDTDCVTFLTQDGKFDFLPVTQ